jgi:hypothetical protein
MQIYTKFANFTGQPNFAILPPVRKCANYRTLNVVISLIITHIRQVPWLRGYLIEHLTEQLIIQQ